MANPLQTIHLSEESNHFTYASSFLALEELQALKGMLQQNKYVFA